jgi:hypothetical protein
VPDIYVVRAFVLLRELVPNQQHASGQVTLTPDDLQFR